MQNCVYSGPQLKFFLVTNSLFVGSEPSFIFVFPGRSGSARALRTSRLSRFSGENQFARDITV